MSQITLITGGCRSGKSRHALEVAQKKAIDNKIFIATCVPNDEEMRKRVSRHQAERDPSWKTIEEPVSIAEAISRNHSSCDIIIVDCLTLWTTNLLMAEENLIAIETQVQQLAKVLKRSSCPVVLVSNEVGAGIVPENRLARLFRDAAGIINQRVAACADQVIWMVAGIPVAVKPGGDQGIRTED